MLKVRKPLNIQRLLCYNFRYNYRVVFIISLENKDVLKEKWTQEALHCLELLQNTFEDIANTVHHNDSIEMYTVGNDVVAAYLAQCLDYLEAIKILYSYKKIDEFDLPNEQFYIFPEVYELSKNANGICFEVGSVSVDEMKSRTMQQAKDIIKDLKEEKQ